MAPSDRTRRLQSFRVVSLLKQLVGRTMRFRRDRRRPARPPAKINLEDLAVAQLVHDLRNQLTLILASAENLVGLVPIGRADQEIAELRECALRASALTRELLTAARPRSAARLAVDLNHIVAPAAEMLTHVIGGVQLQVRLSTEPVPVVGDPAELERILLNLVLNARDAMAGQGVLTIETAVVGEISEQRTIEATSPLSHARLTVTDTGCGMTRDVKARIFEPFFTTKDTGTGLGLTSVAFTVRQLGGTLSIETKPGRGTSVSLILPFAGRRSLDR